MIPCGLCNPKPSPDGTRVRPSRQPHKCWENFFKTKDLEKQESFLVSSESWKLLNSLRWSLVEKKYQHGLDQEEHETLMILSKRRVSYEPKETHAQWVQRKMKERFKPTNQKKVHHA